MTPKGERTRARILAAALELFRTRGYTETTLRDIADEAQVSIGLTYRYFARKESLVLALYAELSVRVARTVALPDGTLGERWAALEHARFTALAPHRKAFLALVQAALDPDGEVGVLSAATQPIRAQWLALHAAVIAGAPPTALATDVLARLSYALDLLLVLLWTQDRTPGAARTLALLDRVAPLLDAVAPLLGLPGVARAITALEAALPLSSPGAEP
jgi:AcrR family transcriptional regulator